MIRRASALRLSIRAAARGGRLCVALGSCVAGTFALASGALAAPLMAQRTVPPPEAPAAPPAAPPVTLHAESTAVGAPRTIDGRVVRPGDRDMLPVRGLWVILHRVGADHAGPLDSTRTDAQGRFHLTYRPFGSSDAVYFASATYDGIAYFSTPLKGTPHLTGDEAEITVYDTTSAPVPLRVKGRHLVVSPPDPNGKREILEVFEIGNDSSVTRISPDDVHPTFSTLVPGELSDFEVGQSEVSPRAFRVSGGRVEVVAPFAPGLKQISFAYRLSASSFPLSVPLVHGAQVFEILLAEPGASATGIRLRQVDPVQIEGQTFRRYLAQDVPTNAVFRISVPAAVGSTGKQLELAAIAIAVGALVLIAGAVFLRRRRGPVRAPAVAAAVPVTPLANGEEDPDAVARAIAALDDDFEHRASPSPEERDTYQARRDELKQRLARALDRQRQRA